MGPEIVVLNFSLSLLSLYSPLRVYILSTKRTSRVYLLLLDNLKDRQFCGFGFSFACGDGFKSVCQKRCLRVSAVLSCYG